MNSFRTTEIVSILGVTPRMLDRWVTEGVIVPSVRSPSGSGVDRVFSFRDVIAVAVVARLRKLGLSLDGMQGAVDRLAKLEFQEHGEAQVDYLACFSKGEVLTLQTADVRGALDKRRGQEVILVDLADIFVNLQGASMEVTLGRKGPKTARKRATTSGTRPGRPG